MTREERENALHCLKVMIDEEVCEECNLYGTTGTDHCEKDCVRVAIKALEQEPRWIPVSERLPKEKTAVLVWCPERKNIYCACYEEKQWWIFGAYFEKVTLEVIAWMPLPKPYKAESEVDNGI